MVVGHSVAEPCVTSLHRCFQRPDFENYRIKLTQNVAAPVAPLQLKIPIVTLGNLPQPVDPERRPVVPLPLSLYKCHLNLLTLHWFGRLKLDYTVQVRFRLNNAASRFCWLITGAPWGEKKHHKGFLIVCHSLPVLRGRGCCRAVAMSLGKKIE